MRSVTAHHINFHLAWDVLLMNSFGEFLKIMVTTYSCLALVFKEIEPEVGKPKVRQIVGRNPGFHAIVGGERIDREAGTTNLTDISIWNGRLRLRGGLCFLFPGQDAPKEIELRVTMNDTGSAVVEALVIRDDLLSSGDRFG